MPPTTRPLNYTSGPLPLRSWNAHSERPYSRFYKERGSRGHVCDRRVHVTNMPPRPSLFVEATVRSFRVCVPASQRERTTCIVERSGSRRLGRDILSEQIFRKKMMLKEDYNELAN